MKGSHPDYEELNWLITLLGIATNPGMFIGEVDLPEVERRALIVTLQDAIQKFTDPLPEVFTSTLERIFDVDR